MFAVEFWKKGSTSDENGFLVDDGKNENNQIFENCGCNPGPILSSSVRKRENWQLKKTCHYFRNIVKTARKSPSTIFPINNWKYYWRMTNMAVTPQSLPNLQSGAYNANVSTTLLIMLQCLNLEMNMVYNFIRLNNCDCKSLLLSREQLAFLFG